MAKADAKNVKLSVGRRVAEERNALGLTQFDLAERIEVSPQYVGLVEQGRQNLTIETIVKVANALEISVSALFEPATTSRPPPGRPRNG